MSDLPSPAITSQPARDLPAGSAEVRVVLWSSAVEGYHHSMLEQRHNCRPRLWISVLDQPENSPYGVHHSPLGAVASSGSLSGPSPFF